MSKTLKVIIIVVLVIVVLGLVLWGAWFWFSRQAFPETSGTITVPGLSQPVEIVRDEYGVAHIYAHNTEDLFFAEGYIHAQERFWQLEFRRRLGAGRLSEIFGETTLSTDKYLRHFGFHDLTEESYRALNDESRSIVDAKVEIEEWTAVDSMIWAEMMIFDQSDQLRTELKNIDMLASVGWDMYADLNPLYRDDRPVIIPSEELDYLENVEESLVAEIGADGFQYLLDLRRVLSVAGVAPPLLADMGFLSTAGSNSFAISGENTTTGTPLLANDPHMGVNMPALWYEIGMHCVEKNEDCIYNLRGFSLPGLPGIVIGHNDRIAWGLTNAAFDAEDVFIERLNPDDPNQYQVNGEWLDMDIRREEIKVRGLDEPVVFFVRSTRNGVVATDSMLDQTLFSHDDEAPELFALSYAWTALEPVQTLEAVLKVNGAQNWDGFLEALQQFDAGKQNWLYADVDGNIGYIMPGKVPILLMPGWNDDYQWTGFIPYEELPRIFNPA